MGELVEIRERMAKLRAELRAWCLDEIHWFAYLSSMLITIMDLLSFVDFL